MAKRKRDRHAPVVPAPTATNVDWPVYVPNSDGTTSIEVGRARLRYGTLVIEFKDSGPAEAIQNMIARGVQLGFATVMIQPDVVNEMYQEVISEEEAVVEATTKAINAGLLRIDEDGKVQAINEDQTVEEVVQVMMNLDKIVIEPPVEENKFTIVAQGDEIDEILKIHEENTDGRA